MRMPRIFQEIPAHGRLLVPYFAFQNTSGGGWFRDPPATDNLAVVLRLEEARSLVTTTMVIVTMRKNSPGVYGTVWIALRVLSWNCTL